MKTEEPDIIDLRNRLKVLGMRFTPQRGAVWRLFRDSRTGYSISEAVELLEHQGVGMATVYRTVAALQEIGRLHRVHDQNGEHRYVCCKSSHGHPLVCEKCGFVLEFSFCDLSVLERLLAVETGFTIKGHHLEVFGICPVCKVRCDKVYQ